MRPRSAAGCPGVTGARPGELPRWRADGGDVEAQVLLDAEHLETGPRDRVEQRRQQGPGGAAIQELRLGGLVVLAVRPDRAAAGRPHVLRPVGLVAERERDDRHVAADPGAHGSHVDVAGSPADVPELRRHGELPAVGDLDYQRVEHPGHRAYRGPHQERRPDGRQHARRGLRGTGSGVHGCVRSTSSQARADSCRPRMASLRGSAMTWMPAMTSPRMVSTRTPDSSAPRKPSRAGWPATGWETSVASGPPQ